VREANRWHIYVSLQDLAAPAAAGLPSFSSLVVVTDEKVAFFHGRALARALSGADFAVHECNKNGQNGRCNAHTSLPAGSKGAAYVYVMPPGETAKTRETKASIEDFLAQHTCHRDTIIVAMGGGVVGDMAGFVAATYMRGVPVIQVPTTLLAMVDSSIGGKTGLDIPTGKNLIGAFHHPLRVYADVGLLTTLPVREIRNGFAEIIKAGAIADVALFEQCELHADALQGDVQHVVLGTETCSFGNLKQWVSGFRAATAGEEASAVAWRSFPDIALLTRVVMASIQVKVTVVSIDEKESGPRAILNFGHTIGHALEAILQPRYLHGECVAIGMVKEIEAARALGKASSALASRVKKLCAAFKLPVTVPPEISGSVAGIDAAMRFMAVDKKNTKGAGGVVNIKCVIIPEIGRVDGPPYTHGVPAGICRRVISHAVHVVAGPHHPGPAIVHVPGSKSLSNRALLLACLARGTTRITGLLASDDTGVMMSCLKALGATISVNAAGDEALVSGTGGRLTVPAPETLPLYVQNAGTASRFLTAVLCLLSLGPGDGPVDLVGNARMHERPIGPLVEALRAQGAIVEYMGTEGCPPLRFRAGVQPGVDSWPLSEGGKRPTHRVVKLKAKLSSQYVSAILMAAPYFPGLSLPGSGAPESVVEIALDEENPTSLPYILMTIQTMGEFGVHVKPVEGTRNRFLVPLGVGYTSPAIGSDGIGSFAVEADASSASYPATFAALLNRPVELPGVGSKSSQGDAGYAFLLQRMGYGVVQQEEKTVVSPPPAGLPYVQISHASFHACSSCMYVHALQVIARDRGQYG
jgi:pentafunctional AROM polypeptide